jgi:WD40 repeat protein
MKDEIPGSDSSLIRHPSSFQPKITDFGLAKQLDSEEARTRTGMVMGTPSYMAPEQASGRVDLIGPATDVYALGAILYEALTGRPPFRDKTILETLEQVRSQDPVSPSRLQPRLPRDLVTICLKCLHKEPHKRYASALALAEDLRRFLTGSPILARPISVWEKTWKWTRRHPAVAALSAAFLLVTLVGAILVVVLWREAVDSAQGEKEARQAKEKALEQVQERAHSEAAARRDAEQRLAGTYLDQGINLSEKGSVSAGMLWMVQALELAIRLEDAGLEHAVRANLAYWRQRMVRQRFGLQHEDWISAVAISPDGKTAVTASKDKTVRLWDMVTGRPIGGPLRHEQPLWAVAFSPDGKTILAGGGPEDPFYATHVNWVIAFHAGGTELSKGIARDKLGQGEVRLWDIQSGKTQLALRHPGSVSAVSYSADGLTLLTVGAGQALLWKNTGRAGAGSKPGDALLPLSLDHPGGVLTAVFHPDGKTVVTGGLDGVLRRWRTDTGQEYGRPIPHPGPVAVAVFQPGGGALLTGCILYDAKHEKIVAGEARLWEFVTGKPLSGPLPHKGPLKGAAFSANGQIIATGGFVIDAGAPANWQGEARVWNADTGRQIGVVLDHPQVVTSIAVSPNGRTVATGSRDGSVRFWHSANGTLIAVSAQEVQYTYGTVTSLAFGAEGRLLLASNLNLKPRAWLYEITPSGARVPPLQHAGQVLAAAFTHDSTAVLTGCGDGTAQFWDMLTGRPIGNAMRCRGGMATVACSANGKTFLTGGSAGEFQIWDDRGARPRSIALARAEPVLAGTFSPDGRLVLTGDYLQNVSLWETSTGRLLFQRLLDEGVYDVAFSADGNTFIAACINGTVSLWETGTRRLLQEWKVSNQVSGVALSPDGQLFATAGGRTQVAQLWDLATGKAVGPPLVHSGVVARVAFSPDGRTIATASQDRTARLWDVATGKPIGPPLPHRDTVVDVRFSPDGRTFLTASYDGTVQRWDVDAPVQGDVERVRLWVETLTGKYMNDRGVVRDLDTSSWQEHGERLERSGGAP